MPAVPLEVRVRSRPSESIIEVVGRLTVDSSPRLRAVLLDSIRARTRSVLVVDLLAVSYCDTSGIATLLEASIAPRNRSVRLRIIGVGGEARMLAEVTELDQLCRALGSEVVFQ